MSAARRHRLRALVPGSDESRSARLSTRLGLAAWVVLLVGGAAAFAVPVPGQGRRVAESVLTVALAALTIVLIARLVATAVAWRERRTGALVLTVSLVLYAAGSSTLTASKDPDVLSFPAPGEGFFLAAYTGMAAFLLIDSVGRRRAGLTTWLEAIITCGGTACLSGAVLLSPAAAALPGEGLQLLLALLYPLFDVLLVVIVLGDTALRRRPWSSQTASLLGGFSMFAIADSTFVRSLAGSGGAYDFSAPLAVTWGVGLTLIVAGGCGPRLEASSLADQRFTTAPPLVAAFTALLVLTMRPSGLTGLYLTVPAVITLAAAGGRLALALREARGAAEAYRLSLTDDLTELPNRRAVLARIQTAITDDTPLGLLLLDLDGFKDVNDTLGHAAGDTVLQLLARRLRAELPSDVLVARLGGDEFALVLPIGDEAAVLRAASAVGNVVARPLPVQGHTFTMGASVGVSLRAPGITASDMLRRADIAMYQAKATQAGALVYDPDRDEFTTERLKTAELLRRGIPDDELRVWYQPQVDAVTNEVTGLEALVRWEHPETGLLAPFHFLPIARQSGLMPLLTEAVTDLMLHDAATWRAKGIRPRISFNIAPPELLNGPLLSRLLARIDAAAFPPGSLVMEVTEDSFLADPERARAALDQISRHDVQVAIDDYGTGFSSLSYLRDLPVHELKMDRSFISAVPTDPRSRIIVASTNQMARGLGLRTVAEGVEDADIAARLRALGVDVLQGYHIARPMPSDDVEGWLQRWSLRQQAVGAAALPS